MHLPNLRLIALPLLLAACSTLSLLAAQTGTELIVSRGGVITRIRPAPDAAVQRVQEAPVPYKDAP